MSKWKKMTIGDFITLQRGHDLTNKEREIGNVPVYGAAGKNGYHSKSLANGPGLIIGRSGGSFGKVYFVRENYWPHNTGLYTTDFKGNDPRFAFYLLTQMDLSSLNSGSAQPSLNRNYIYPLPIEVPEPDQQRKIAAVLSALDDKIELNNQINTELEHMAKTLYDYWFVQFEFPDVNGKPYKSSGGKMVYDEVLKRQIPDGWEVKKLNEVTNIIAGGDKPQKFSESINQECTIPIYSNGVQNDGLYGFTDEARIKKQSITISARGTIGYCVLRNNPFVPIIRLIAVTPKMDGTALFYYYSIKNLVFENSGSVQKQLTVPQVSMLTINIPGFALLNNFSTLTSPLVERMEIIKKQNRELAALRDWLLPMLMNGQAKVSDSSGPDIADLSLAAEPEMSYGQVEPLDIPANKKAFAKQALAGKIVSTFRADPNFTDIKFQKVQFLAEHLIEADLNLNYYYQAAGPYDNKFMHTIYDDFRKQKWFDCKNKQFIPLEKQEKIEVYYQGYFAPAQKRLETLFDILFQVTEAGAEIIATVYAVWNNRIIEARQATDEELIADFYEWSDRKQRYSRSQIENGIEFLRLNGIAPKGFGQLIKRAKSKN